jgi:hypothetical protein
MSLAAVILLSLASALCLESVCANVVVINNNINNKEDDKTPS